MIAIPRTDPRLVLRVLTNTDRESYRRQDYRSGPICPHCGARYIAGSTHARYTHYYPACKCAPRGGIKKIRVRR